MEVFSTQPGVQFYSGNFLGGVPTYRGDEPSHGGRATFRVHEGLCLETQAFPDAVNQPEFPTAILDPSQRYLHTTVYRFTTVA